MKEKKKSLVDVIMVNMLLMISLPLVLLGGIVVFGEYHFFRQERDTIKKAYIKEQEAIFKHEVEKAIDYIRWTRKPHVTPGDEQESEMLNWISRIRSGRLSPTAYLPINRKKAVSLIHLAHGFPAFATGFFVQTGNRFPLLVVSSKHGFDSGTHQILVQFGRLFSVLSYFPALLKI